MTLIDLAAYILLFWGYLRLGVKVSHGAIFLFSKGMIFYPIRKFIFERLKDSAQDANHIETIQKSPNLTVTKTVENLATPGWVRFLAKPIILCNICAASFWGTLLFSTFCYLVIYAGILPPEWPTPAILFVTWVFYELALTDANLKHS